VRGLPLFICINLPQLPTSIFQYQPQTEFNISTKSYHPSIVTMSTSEIPQGDAVDNDYKSRTGQSEIPVQSDEAAVEATEYDNGGDSDKQLGMLPILRNASSLLNIAIERDEKDAIDQSNIIDSRTRGAAKQSGAYTEPGDEEEVDNLTAGGQDGTSSGRQ
jgi:hypothetical protein